MIGEDVVGFGVGRADFFYRNIAEVQGVFHEHRFGFVERSESHPFGHECKKVGFSYSLPGGDSAINERLGGSANDGHQPGNGPGDADEESKGIRNCDRNFIGVIEPDLFWNDVCGD